MNVAFKEWAVICRLLAQGRQSVILRKGGIAEDRGEFKPEHTRFWLYPTYFHERQRDGIRPEYLTELDAADAERPAEGLVRLSHGVEVTRIEQATTLDQALAYSRLHAAEHPRLIRETPEYAGCKSWVNLRSEDC